MSYTNTNNSIELPKLSRLLHMVLHNEQFTSHTNTNTNTKLQSSIDY